MIAARIIAGLAAGLLIFALACGKYGKPVRSAKYRAATQTESVEIPAQAEEDDEPDAESIILGPPEAPEFPVP